MANETLERARAAFGAKPSNLIGCVWCWSCGEWHQPGAHINPGSSDSECAPIARWNRPRGPFPPCAYAACDYHEWAGPPRDDLADVDHDIEEHRADTKPGDSE